MKITSVDRTFINLESPVYIGDGVYAGKGAYSGAIIIATERENGWHYIYLDQPDIEKLLNYAKGDLV